MATQAQTQIVDLDGVDVAPIASTSTNNDEPLFTCLSCSIGYANPEDQRAHYRTDLHRYNMKRRVANLPPLRADAFNAKILERKEESDPKSSPKQGRCQACQKSFSSANAYQSHLKSKKHKEMEQRGQGAASKMHPPLLAESSQDQDPLLVTLPAASKSALEDVSALQASLPAASESSTRKSANRLQVAEDATEEEIAAVIDAKVASSRRIDPEVACLFCSTADFTSLDDSLDHMTRLHGFFVPEQEYLVERLGLMKYLSDKICIGNMCLYCNGRGRGFATGEAARKHMIDKSHCKVAYESEEDKLELSDFYDFTSSYPDAQWEDVSDEEGSADGGDEVYNDDDDEETDGEELLPSSNEVRYGDNEFELVLPSGVRLGHRSLRRYYNQSLRPTGSAYTSGNTSGREVAHRLVSGQRERKDDTLVENRGGHMIKARNRGEAREAKKHISTYRDVVKKEHFKTQIGYRNNSQKHFRDPLLQ